MEIAFSDSQGLPERKPTVWERFLRLKNVGRRVNLPVCGARVLEETPGASLQDC